jgi:hypothetical protein
MGDVSVHRDGLSASGSSAFFPLASERATMFRKLLVMVMTTSALPLAFLLPGCGSDSGRAPINGEPPVPTVEEKAELKVDYSQK